MKEGKRKKSKVIGRKMLNMEKKEEGKDKGRGRKRKVETRRG